MKRAVTMAKTAAKSGLNILLTGDTGTGKDLLARYIHHHSGREGEFVPINAAAIPDEMVESELFGHVKGAFTGANHDKQGLFEAANDGTFYLNEIGDSTPQFQAKLLEVLETFEIRRLGETKRRQVSFNLISATNHDLFERLREGRFRSDLYHRLKEMLISLPPLAERIVDIPALVGYFLSELMDSEKIQSGSEYLDKFSRVLAKRMWPGNVRELRAAVKNLWVVSEGDPERMVKLALNYEPESLRDELLIILRETNWNRREVARRLGVSETTVRNWIRKYDIPRK